MPFTDYLDQKLVQFVFGGVSYTPPATLYVALSTTTPKQVKGATVPYWTFTEPSGNAYARVGVAHTSGQWTLLTIAAGAEVDNANTITFPAATGSWGTLTYFGIFDAATAGNLLGYGALSAPQAIGSGATARFAAGALTVTND